MFETKIISENPDVIAPDGSDVRILLSLSGGSMAHFSLAAGKTSVAVAHFAVEEIWYFLGGYGEMWRKLDEQEEIVNVEAGACITIPKGTHFQFRSIGPDSLSAIAITMPPWPGEGAAYQVQGIW
ncbi:MAG TPA: hypothetical protein VMT73_02010 [Anaerolineales bacterium]|nr:hypothetical protein [Anaerolineales bacterium]